MPPPRFAFLAVALLVVSVAHADEIAPGCDADLAALDASFDESLARLDKAHATDHEENCASIVHHIDVMRHAADVFDRCLPDGHDKGENIGQVVETARDFSEILEGEECPPYEPQP